MEEMEQIHDGIRMATRPWHVHEHDGRMILAPGSEEGDSFAIRVWVRNASEHADTHIARLIVLYHEALRGVDIHALESGAVRDLLKERGLLPMEE